MYILNLKNSKGDFMKNKTFKILRISLAIIILLAVATVAAFYTVYKMNPDAFLKMYRKNSFTIEEISAEEKGYLRISGNIFQIYSEEGTTLSMDDGSVAVYSQEEEPRIALYKDSGIKAGSLAGEELLFATQIESPSDFFKFYEEKDSTQAERMRINERDCYVTYTRGNFKDQNPETQEPTQGIYTEVYILQDIGVETYLSIRIADYSGGKPVDLIQRYVLTVEPSTT